MTISLIKNINPFIAIFLGAAVVIGLGSCNGSKAFAKRGAKLEDAGLYAEAAHAYYVALQKNRTNVDAQIGMKSTGQLVLNDKLNEFVKAKNFGEKKEAVYKFQDAESYFNKINGVGVKLTMADYYLSDYNDVKAAYLADLYDEGTQLLEDEQFGEAERIFDEISLLNPGFKDAEELKLIAYAEPLYAVGVQEMNAGHWRSAHANFQKIVNRKSTYKDAKALMNECVETGRFSMAILPFENATNQSGLDAKVGAYALDALASIDDPFLKIVDRENLQTIMEEQQLGLSGVIDEQTAVNVGELMGAQALITGTVLSHHSSTGRAQMRTIPAFEQYKEKKWNAEEEKYYMETKYRKTNYREYSNANSATLSFQFKVISLQTGEVILSKIVERENRDDVLYATYEGDPSNLFPSRNNAVSMNRADRQALQRLFSAPQVPRTTSELSNELFGQVSDVMKQEVSQYLMTAIP